MQTKIITIQNKLGLHARAAAKIAHLADKFNCHIFLSKLKNNAPAVNAKDIVDLMMLGAHQGSKLTLTAEGHDEVRAMAAISELIDNFFGEAE